MDCTETMHIAALSLLGKSCPFRNVSISLSCQNEFASLQCFASLGYIFEHPKTRFTTLWICAVSFTCRYFAALLLSWTCVLKATLQWGQVAQGSPPLHCPCQLQVTRGLCFQHFICGIAKLVHEQNRVDMIYWGFNIQDCPQDLFSVNLCYFLLNDFVF